MDDDDEVMETMRQVDQALGTGGGAHTASLTIPDPCAAYDKIRDILPSLIKLAKKVPVVGKRIAAALELLQAIGDKCCRPE